MSCLTVENSAEFRTEDNLFLKEMNLPAAGMVVAQHAHKYDHTTLLAKGSLRAWRGTEFLGEFHAPITLHIPANTKHSFLSLEPTIAYCIHRMAGDGQVEIIDEHLTADALRAVAA